MKKAIILLMCTIMLLTAACSRTASPTIADATEGSTTTHAEMTDAAAVFTESAPEPDNYEGKEYCFDYHPGSYGAISDTYIMETDDTIYYLCNNVMYFSDKAYKDFMPLCPRPECAHSGSDCDAYIDTVGGFWIYGHYIYYLSFGLNGKDPDDVKIKNASLWRMRFDGTKHEEVYKFEAPDLGFTPRWTDWQFFFSGKYLTIYYYCRKYETDITSGFVRGLLTLDDLNYVERERYDKYDPREHRTEDDLDGNVIFCEGSLYYCLNCVYTGTGPFDRRYRITAYNIETDEYTLIADLDEQPAYLDGLIMKKDGDILYMPYLGEEGQKSIHAVDLDTGEDKTTASGDLDTLGVSLFDWSRGWLCGTHKDPGNDPASSGFCVYDEEGDLLEIATCEGLPEETLDLAVFLQTENYFFASPLTTDEFGNVIGVSLGFSVPTWYIDKSEIGTGNLAWHRWAPDGD